MTPIIYTCTLNPAIDLFVDVNELQPFVVNRTNAEDYSANGKTINISFLLKRMGLDNTALGFIAGFTGAFIKEELEKQGISTNFIEVDGITRVNTFIRAKDKEYKVVNKGPGIPRNKVTQLLNKIQDIPSGSFLFVSGSVPKGVDEEVYVEIAKICQKNGLKLILDISSKKLLDCLPYRPYLIKPNEEELAAFFDKEHPLTEDELVSLGEKLLEKGSQSVLISLGDKGSIYLTRDGITKVNTPQGKVVNTTCAGDSLLGSFVGKLVQGAPLEEALAFASATGASTAFTAGLSDLSDVDQLMKQIKVMQIKTSIGGKSK